MKYQLKDIISEYTEKNTNGEYEPVAVGKYGIRKRSDIYKKELAKDYSKNKVIRKNTMIVGMGSTQIDIGVLSSDDIYSVSPAYHTFSINSSIIRSEYLDYLFQAKNSLYTSRYMIASARQGKTVNLKDMLFETVDIPDFDVQQKTVEKINEIKDCISLEEKQLALYDELIKSRFIEMFDKDIQNTKMNILDDYCEFVTVGIANSAVHAFCNDGVIMFRNQNIRENYLDTNDVIRITEDFATKYKSKALKENDILAVRTGYPGVSCVVPKEYEGCQTFTTLIARLNDTSAVNPHYLCYFINSKYGKEYVKGNSVGAAQQNFGATAFAKMPVYIPPIDRQLEFVEFSKQIDKSKFIVQKRIDTYKELLAKKMDEYFN